jgi:hypothetical protein
MVMAATELVKNHKSVIPTVGQVSDMTKNVQVTHSQLPRPPAPSLEHRCPSAGESCGLAVEHSAHDRKVVGSIRPIQC